jgi:hypothetical protein
MKRPIEEYVKQADTLAQDVVNAWGVNVQAGNGPVLTDEFNDLLDKACRFRTTKEIAANHREFGMLTEEEAATLQANCQMFAQAYKAFYEKHES